MKKLFYETYHTPTFLFSELLRKIFFCFTIQLLLVISITSAYSAQVILAWEPNAESDVAGYKIHYGNSSKNYTRSVDVKGGSATTCTISNLIEGQTYYFSATAYNTSLLESDYSAEISCTASSPDNSVKVWCPFFFLTNNDTEKITKLRDFRNNVLLKTPMGKEYVRLFYKNAMELITILINNAGVADESKIVLEKLLPKIKLAVAGQRINITPILLLEIEGILNQISMEASIELQHAIEKLKEDLREETMLNELGIEVNFLN